MADLSTLGVKLYYAVETTKGTKPTTGWKQLKRVNSIGGIELSTENIDASALEDEVSQYTKGRSDLGGTWEVTFNMNASVISDLKTMMQASKTAKASEKGTWFQVVFPDLDDAFFVIAEPGADIPLPDIGQNELATLPMTLVINEYKGLQAKVTVAA